MVELSYTGHGLELQSIIEILNKYLLVVVFLCSGFVLRMSVISFSHELPSRIEMESCVQQWISQLTPLLEAEERGMSERSSLNDEIVYWRSRSQDLENIFAQLKEGIVRQMAATLEDIVSQFATSNLK